MPERGVVLRSRFGRLRPAAQMLNKPEFDGCTI